MARCVVVVFVAMLAAGCSPPQPSQQAPRSTPPTAPTPPLTAAGVPVVARPAVVVPPDALYVCAVEEQGYMQTTVIELSPQVAQLCRKNPEMSPCKYEREACRRGGGRVFAAPGEISAATEAEYDKRVLRLRLRSD